MCYLIILLALERQTMEVQRNTVQKHTNLIFEWVKYITCKDCDSFEEKGPR